jgi:uncharacterized membrane protein
MHIEIYYFLILLSLISMILTPVDSLTLSISTFVAARKKDKVSVTLDVVPDRYSLRDV